MGGEINMNEPYCKWLPPLLKLEDYNGDWNSYNNELYKIFKNDFIENTMLFNKKPIQVRVNPKQNNYEHAFIHITCVTMNGAKNMNDRIPDLRRCERIAWNRKIIENYPCVFECENCYKILYYEEYYKNTIRISLLFYNQNYKVVLEKRKNYYLFITGFYINYNHRLKKEMDKVVKYNKQKTPLD